MKIFSKLFDYIATKIAASLSEIDKKRITDFPKTRERFIGNMERKQIFGDSKIKLHGILITFFGCGKLRHGSGTLASFATAMAWLAVSYLFIKIPSITNSYEMFFWIAISIFLFVYGLIFIPLYERYLGTHDHPSIVIDEVVGQIISLCLTYPFVKEYYFDNTVFLHQLIMMAHLILSFILFRFLDIIKPFFIGWIDNNVKGSFGVMLDDLVCGLVTAGINITIFWIYKNSLVKVHSFV